MNPHMNSYEEHRAFREKYFVEVHGSDTPENREKIKAVARRYISFMLDWFDKVKTTDDLINELTEYVGLETGSSFPYGAYWVRGFLFDPFIEITEKGKEKDI